MLRNLSKNGLRQIARGAARRNNNMSALRTMPNLLRAPARPTPLVAP